VVVVCGPPEFEDHHVDTLLNPMVIVEVLSESTEKDDRGRKWEHYRRLASLREYLLVAQDQPTVEHYLRHQGGIWSFSEASGFGAAVELPTIGCTLELGDIYAKAFPVDSRGG
jgi:Uma2 family endonuclease